MQNNWFHNPIITVLKTHLSRILNGRYPKHDDLIERLGANLTQKDLQAFNSFIADVYELGYLKAIGDYEKEFQRLGYKVNIVAEKPDSHDPIFK